MKVTYSLVLGIESFSVHARPAPVLLSHTMLTIILGLDEIRSDPGIALTLGVMRHVSFSAAGEAKNFFDYRLISSRLSSTSHRNMAQSYKPKRMIDIRCGEIRALAVHI